MDDIAEGGCGQPAPKNRRRPVLTVAAGFVLLIILVGWLLAWLGPDNRPSTASSGWNQPSPLLIGKPSPADGERLTLDDFREMVADHGLTHVETDLRLIDGGGHRSTVLVAIHDLDGEVPSLTTLEADGDADGVPDLDIAELGELLTDPGLDGIYWNFELKGGTVETARVLNAELDDLAADDPDVRDRLCISYGDIRSQKLVNEIRGVLHADMCSCASFPEKSSFFDWTWSSGLTAPLRPVSEVPISCIQVIHELITPADVAEAHEAGLCIHAWELQLPGRFLGQDLPPEVDGVTDSLFMDRARMHELLDMGVDGIMSYRPGLVAAVLAERGSRQPNEPNCS